MRISQRQMFSTYTSQMNTALGNVMESNNKAGTGKRVNRPSDDPAAMARIMMYRQSLSNINIHKGNISEATGWLNLADKALMQVSEVISIIKTLDLQGSTGTVNADNREQISYQLRGHLGQLLNIANTDYNGQHLFSGHKTGKAAFVEGLGVSCHDDNIKNGDFIATGGAKYSTLIQFTTDGDLSSSVPGSTNAHPDFVYSEDGGSTWKQGTWQGGTWNSTTNKWDDRKMIAGGVSVEPQPPTDGSAWGPVTAVPQAVTLPSNPNVKESAGGTWMYVRPTAIYQGDDHDTQVTQQYGAAGLAGLTSADGYFTRDVAVRIDSSSATEVSFSYSIDNGSNWVTGKVPVTAGQNTMLPIPGGYFKLDAGNTFTAGQQFIVHPHRADINIEIANNQTITVNMVGKDVFGGLYQEPFGEYPKPANGGMNNLFETLGRLIGYAECNDQDGIGRGMDELNECLKFITTRNTEIGARENRLQVAFETISMRELSEMDGVSAIENVDTLTLMTKLAQQQLAYNTVLKSSSMIMQMSLMNFI